MKELFGGPGKLSGLCLRIGQCLFAAASLGVMASASGFSTATAFCYLIASMGLQLLWSFGLACFDIHALRLKRDLHNHVFVSLFVVGDWVINSLLSVIFSLSQHIRSTQSKQTINSSGIATARDISLGYNAASGLHFWGTKEK